ncbi:hypothetical protein BH11ARM1_BH11ARM1_15840 [soil metagenome]
MIPQGYTVLLASDTKAGKSSLARAITLAVATDQTSPERK